MIITDEMVDLAKAAYDGVYSAEYEMRGAVDSLPYALRAALEAVAPMIAAAEREECAKIAESLKTLKTWMPIYEDRTGENEHVTTHGIAISDAIRARNAP